MSAVFGVGGQREMMEGGRPRMSSALLQSDGMLIIPSDLALSFLESSPEDIIRVAKL